MYLKSYVLYINNKKEPFSLKGGCAYMGSEAFKRRLTMYYI